MRHFATALLLFFNFFAGAFLAPPAAADGTIRSKEIAAEAPAATLFSPPPSMHQDHLGSRRETFPTRHLLAKKNKEEDANGGEDGPASPLETFRKSPGALIATPFLLLFGLDLLANIAVVTKRSIEVALTGHYTVWNPFE